MFYFNSNTTYSLNSVLLGFTEICNMFGKFFTVLVETTLGTLPITYGFFMSSSVVRYFDVLTPLIVLMFVFVYMCYYRRSEDTPGSWLYCFLVFFGSVGLYSANSLVDFTVFWVILNVSLYGLMLKNILNGYAVETVVKYFLLGAVTTSVLFFGLFINFAIYQSLNYSDISFLVETSILVSGGTWVWSVAKSAAFLCVFIAFLFKLGAYPFHFYLPSMYEGLDYRTLGVVSIPVKWFAFVAMVKYVSIYGTAAATLYPFFIVLGFGSLFFGSYGLFVQNRLRSFWAFSYLGSLGFVFLGVSVCSLSLVWSASVFYFVTYLFTWGILFYILGLFSRNFSGNDFYVPMALNEPRYMSDFARLCSYGAGRVKFRVLFLTCLFSMAGVPPAIGFIAKLVVLSSLAKTSFGFIFVLFTVVTMIMSAVGYLRLISAIIVMPGSFSHFRIFTSCGRTVVVDNGGILFFDLFAIIICFAGLVVFVV